MATRNYEISTDFGGISYSDIHPEVLRESAKAAMTEQCTLVDVNPAGNSGRVVFWFIGEPDSADDTALDAVVAAYDPADGPTVAVAATIPTEGDYVRASVTEGVNTSPQTLYFDQEDTPVSSEYFENLDGVFLAKKSFYAKFKVNVSVVHVSGTSPTVTLALVKNGDKVFRLSKSSCNATTHTIQMSVEGGASFELNNEFRVEVYTSAGEVLLPAFTASLSIKPKEVE